MPLLSWFFLFNAHLTFMAIWSSCMHVMSVGGDHSVPKALPEDLETTSHNLVIRKSKEMLEVMLDDPFLTDQRDDCCGLESAQSQVALFQGRAITINISKLDGQVIPVIVLQGATVGDLVQTFQRKVKELCTKEDRTKHLSWKYVWKNYCLVYGQSLLEDLHAKLVSYGIGNQASLHFTKKLRKKLKSNPI